MFITIVIILLTYLLIRLSCGITKSPVCLKGKTAIITGANSGIGYQVALNLASRGCRLILADKDNLEDSAKNIIAATKNSEITIKHLDLRSFKSVRNFANDVLATEQKLDILINNAGIAAASQTITEDGLETVMQVNLFSTFLLTYLLCDLLKKSPSSRVIFTSSILAYFGYLNINNLQENQSYDSFFGYMFNYSNSKIATIMISDIFAEKLKRINVSSNSIHPGCVRTPIIRKFANETNTGFFVTIMHFLLLFSGKSIWEGAQTTTHVAISDDLKNITGKFFCDCIHFPKPYQARNKKLAKEVWDLCEEVVNLSPEERNRFERAIA